LFAHERGDAHDPAAVGAIVLRPKMRAVDGRSGLQDLCQLCGQACIAEFSLPAGEFITILEIAELIFQLDELGGKEQILGGIVRNIVGDGIVQVRCSSDVRVGFAFGVVFRVGPEVLALLSGCAAAVRNLAS